LQVLNKLELVEFLESVMPLGREEIAWSMMSLVLVLSRLCDPSSELYIAEHLYERTALGDLLGVPVGKVNDDRLYRAPGRHCCRTRAHWKASERTLGELFEIEYDLLLYDVTSTYFEVGRGNEQAKRGYSRDHRGDCKQVCIALVVSKCGMPLAYEVFDGNRNDSTTVEQIVASIESKYGSADRIWVMDRSMVSQENVEFLRRTPALHPGDSKGTLKRFEGELLEVVGKRSEVVWSKVDAWREWSNLSEGCYLLRSNITTGAPRSFGRHTYSFTQAEAAFRITKSDLSIRRYGTRRKSEFKRHILVCLLAYVIWKALGQLCERGRSGR